MYYVDRITTPIEFLNKSIRNLTRGKQRGIAQPDQHPLGHFGLVAPLFLAGTRIFREAWYARARASITRSRQERLRSGRAA
jgi:hypothetical protein